jgi:ankyrin repeat protein
VNHDSGLNSIGNRSRKEFVYSRDKGVFSSAIELRRKDVFDYLFRLDRFDTDWKDFRGRTPLWWACKKRWEDLVRFLLNKGTDFIDLKTKDGTIPLRIAVAEGHKCVVELLLDAGADVSAQGGYYGNALQAASRLGHKEVVRLLLGRGANVNTQSGNYTNALQAASYGGQHEIVSLLLGSPSRDYVVSFTLIIVIQHGFQAQSSDHFPHIPRSFC